MYSLFVIAALGAIAPVFAEELRAADVPAACTTICEPIVTLTNICDIDPNEADNDKDDNKRRKLRLRDDKNESNEEAIEANCICTNKSFDVANVLALCASCITQTGKKSEDVDKIMKQCSFRSANYTPAATTVVVGIQVQATKPATTTEAAPTASGNSNPSTTTEPGNSAGSRAISPVAAVLGAGLAAVYLF